MIRPGRAQTFTEHLEELRVRIIICVVFFLFAFLLSFAIAPRVLGWLIVPLTRVTPSGGSSFLTIVVHSDGSLRLSPHDEDVSASLQALELLAANGKEVAAIQLRLPSGQTLSLGGTRHHTNLFFLSPLEPFMLLLKGALLVSALVAIPMVIYQLWLFIAPGLFPRERRVVKPVLVASLFLFPVGAIFAYFLSHVMLRVLLGFSNYIPGLEPNLVASKYLGFMLTLMLAFGLVFEFPLVLLLFARLGFINASFLAERRKFAIVLVAVAAAAITPTPDPLNMLLVMTPLILLYEVSIWVIRAVEQASDRALVSTKSS